LIRGIIYTHYDEMAGTAVTPASTQHGKRLLLSTLLACSEGAHQLVEGDQPPDRPPLPEPRPRM
jgi:hypothetical protein